MTDVTADDSVDEDIDAPEDEEGSGGGSGGLLANKKLLIIVAAVVLLLGGAGGAYFMGLFDGLMGPSVEAAKPDAVVFFDLPELVVNLTSGSKKQSYLKVQFSLELDENADMAFLQRILPRLIDQFQVYLRELRTDDLQGSAGIYRLKEELLRRLNVAAHPLVIRDVLFKEMLIQ